MRSNMKMTLIVVFVFGLLCNVVVAANPKGVSLSDGLAAIREHEASISQDGASAQDVAECVAYDKKKNPIYQQFVDCVLCFISCLYDISPFDPYGDLTGSYSCSGGDDCYCFWYQVDGGSLEHYDNLACGGGQGDPHFLGFDGTPFEFHGVHGAAFNLFSNEAHQVNALLDNLGFDGATFLRTVSVTYGADVHILVDVSSQAVNNSIYGTLAMQVNGEDLELEGPSIKKDTGKHVHVHVAHPFVGSYMVTVRTPELAVKISKKDPYALHLDVSISFNHPVNHSKAHGVLGQTLAWRQKGVPKMLQGDEIDYLVEGIWGDDFKFNMFEGGEAAQEPVYLRQIRSLYENVPIMAGTTFSYT